MIEITFYPAFIKANKKNQKQFYIGKEIY